MKFMLIKMGLVEKETLDRIENLFAVFDEDDNGTLGVDDIRLRKKRLRDLVSVCFACASKSKNTSLQRMRCALERCCTLLRQPLSSFHIAQAREQAMPVHILRSKGYRCEESALTNNLENNLEAALLP